MSTVEGGGNLGETYFQYVRRVGSDNGYYSKPKTISLTSTLASLNLNPSLVIPSNAGKVGKVYSAIPNDSTGDLTIVRNTTATYMGSDGLIKTAVANEPRFEFEPITGNFKGLLVEPQRTNLVKYSQDFTQNVWDKGGSTIISTTRTAPDGSSTADELDDTGASSTPGVTIQSIIATATIVTYSIYTKNVSSTTRSFLLRNHTTSTNFDLLTFNYSSTGNLGNGWFSENVGNGWFRLSYTRTSGISIGNNLFIYYGRISAAAVGSTSKWQVWGGQLEDGINVTSYIPTLDSTVTRNADVVTKTGISSLIGQTEGTIFVDFNITNNDLSSNKTIFFLDDNTYYVNTICARIFSTGIFNLIFRSSSTAISFTNMPTLANGNHKLLVKYGNGFVSIFVDGVLVDTKSWSIAFTNQISQLYIGKSRVETPYFTDTVKSLSLWKTVLTNTQAIQLTTL
jgi:hypothetical protein